MKLLPDVMIDLRLLVCAVCLVNVVVGGNLWVLAEVAGYWDNRRCLSDFWEGWEVCAYSTLAIIIDARLHIYCLYDGRWWH